MPSFLRSTAKFAAAACIAAAAFQGTAFAQEYPARPIRLAVGFAPGGILDSIARVMAQRLTTHLGQPIVVENKPGADGRIAIQQLVTAPPDGYSLALADSGLAVNAVLFQPPPYDPIKDFTPVFYLGEVPNFIAITPSLNVSTLGEFVQYAKARPGKLNYAATASSTLLAAELFKYVAGVDIVRIPYKGQALGIPALLAGDVHLMVSAVGPLAPLAKQGKIRTLAVTSQKRSPIAPDVPTATEAGLPAMVYVNWYVFIAPAGLPRPIADRLYADLRKTAAEPETIAALQKLGVEPNPASPEEFATMLKSELSKFEKVVTSANLKIQ